MTFTRTLPVLLALVSFSKTSAFGNGVLSEDGLHMGRRLQRRLQFEDLPEICTGFELIIDEIPEGRDSCDCDGTAVHCLFKAHCKEDQIKNNDPHCQDAVKYVVAFEDDTITVESCALITEGEFEETCAKVSLAPDLQLDDCVEGSYGGRPCDCTVCEGRGSLKLDCTAYDPRAITNCQAMGMGHMAPLSSGFNTTAAPPSDSLDTPSSEDEDESQSPGPAELGESACRHTTATLALVAAAAAAVASMF